VHIAVDTDEALALFDRHRFHYVFTDIFEPQVNGWAVLMKASQQDALRIVATDSNAMLPLRYKNVVDLRIHKPFERETIAQIILENSDRVSGLSALSSKRIKRAITEFDRIPVHPLNYMRLRDAMDNSKTNMQNITLLIMADVGLTTRVLKTVNSAQYGLKEKIVSVDRAVMQIGLKGLGELIFDTCYMVEPKNYPAGYIDFLWKYTLTGACYARLIAETMHEDDQFCSEVFTGAMLRDIGRLVFLHDFRDEYATLMKDNEEIDFSRAEARYFEMDHAMIGGLLLEDWSFPKRMAELVRMHHAPKLDADTTGAQLIVHWADRITGYLHGRDHEFMCKHVDCRASDDFLKKNNIRHWTKLCGEYIPFMISDYASFFQNVIGNR
jgi:HD-like signal output (HDOD) protein